MKSKAFIQDYPVNFRLLNSKQTENIYIEDNPASAFLEIKNESGQDIYFATTDNPNFQPGPGNFHFALTFQPGILKTSIKHLIKDKLIKKGWVMSIQTKAVEKEETEVYAIIYLLNKNKDVLKKDDTLYFALKNLALDCEIGSQITQVELDCKHLSHDINFHSKITSKANHYNLTLINHRGLPFMPLHVGFTDINTVLNSKVAEDNNLSLRITNLQSPNPDKDHHFLFSHRKHSKIYLFFDTDDAEQSYAIATNDEVEAYKIEIRQPNQKKGTYLIAEPAFQGDMPIWEIAPQDGDVILEAHGHINEDMERVSGLPDDSCFDIDISKIITNTTNGITHLRLRFENIPGFWDHTFSIPIVKQPLIIKDHSVGIGTSEPIEKLEVKGDIFCNANNIWIRGRGDNAKERLRLHHNGKSAYIDWNEGDFNVRNHTNTKLSINPNGNVNVTGAIVPSTGNTENKGIMFPKDPGGGRGDAAWIRYYARSGEATTLEIGTSNDKNDHIALMSQKGNVGIGTTTPDHKLEIGHYKDINDNYLSIRTAGGSKFKAGIKLQHYDNRVGWVLVSDDKSRDFHIMRYYNNTKAEEAISIKGSNGNVGIGTNNPTKAKLQVDGHDIYDHGEHSYYAYRSNKPVMTGKAPGGNFRASIHASERIIAAEFNAISDERIKHVLGRSDAVADLHSLNAIKVMDYKYIDVVQKGESTYKKAIAQQVEKVYPQAVQHTTDVIPDIFKRAKIKKGWVELSTDLKEGENVQLIIDDKKEVYKIIEVKTEAFKVNVQTKETEIFVYGRQVEDFRLVDYDAISMLNVSATQELYRKVEEQQQTINDLQIRLENLETVISKINI